MSTSRYSAINATRPADPTEAVRHFSAKLAFETDPSDVYADLSKQRGDFVVVDTRGAAAWRQGRVPGAVHIPTAQVAQRAAAELPRDVTIVTYCWGPGCNGSTRAALELARLGYAVKEMIGGYEYWVREGLPVETDQGVARHQVDPLTAPTPRPKAVREPMGDLAR